MTSVALIVVAAVAAVTVLAVRRQPDWSLAGADPAALLVEVLAALALAAAGHRRFAARGSESRSGTLFIAAAAAWLHRRVEQPRSPRRAGVHAGLVLERGVRAGGRARAARSRPRKAARPRTSSTAVTAAYAGLLVLGGLGATLASDPGAQGCASCPPNLLRLADAQGPPPTCSVGGSGWGSAALVLAVALLARSLLASEHGAPARGGTRRGRRPRLPGRRRDPPRTRLARLARQRLDRTGPASRRGVHYSSGSPPESAWQRIAARRHTPPADPDRHATRARAAARRTPRSPGRCTRRSDTRAFPRHR